MTLVDRLAVARGDKPSDLILCNGQLIKLLPVKYTALMLSYLAIMSSRWEVIITQQANGCPFRQHVLASQGIVSSITYLTGFYVGAILFHTVVLPLLLRFLL